MSECKTGCGRPTQVTLCTFCLSELVTDLRQLVTGGVERVRVHRVPEPGVKPDEQEMREVVDIRPGLYEELEVTLVRLGKAESQPGRSSGADRPTPFHPTASEVRWALNNTITTWARDLAELHPHLTLTAITTTQAADWMANLAGLIAEHPAADQMHDEVTDAVAQVRRVIDRHAEKVRLGKCGAVHEGVKCEEDLYGEKDRNSVQCKTCGTLHDAAERWESLQQMVRASLASAAEIAAASVRIYGQALNVKTIRTWANRKQIESCGKNGYGEPLHKVGEVLDYAHRRGVWRKVA